MRIEPEFLDTPGGFGGWFFDADGHIAVWLVDLAQAEAARAVLEPVVERLGLRRRRAGDPPRRTTHAELRFRQGRYNCRQLAHWYRALAPTPAAERAEWWSHIDERRNVLAYGVLDEATASKVRAQAEALGIPSQAVLVEVTGRSHSRLGP